MITKAIIIKYRTGTKGNRIYIESKRVKMEGAKKYFEISAKKKILYAKYYQDPAAFHAARPLKLFSKTSIKIAKQISKIHNHQISNF